MRAARLVGLLAVTPCLACTEEPAPASARASYERTDSVEERAADTARLDEILGHVLEERFDEAIPALQALLDERPGLGRAELYLGMCFQKQKHYGKARPWLEAAAARVDAFPGQESAWYFLGWCLYNLGDVQGARGAFEEHLSRAPDEGDSHFGLGLVELEAGNLDEAVVRWRRSIELHRAAVEASGVDRSADIAKAHARIADVHVLRGEWPQAREELMACVTLWPPHHAAWYKLHQVLLELGEERAAAEALREHDLWKARRPMTADELEAAAGG